MADRSEWLLTTAARIAEGTPVDWQKLEASATSESFRALLHDLKIVAAVADVARVEATSTWGRLQLLEKIGEGAFGEVFRAWDPHLEREVALKILKGASPPLNGLITSLEEARMLARVHHPNVAAVYGAECVDGRVGIWMELVRGESLDTLAQRKPRLRPLVVVSIGTQLCHALEAVHRAQVVHRDVKCSNLMKAEDGRIVLMDFGLGLDRAVREPGDVASMAGTPLYVAPEILEGGEATPQSDIYSAGVVLFHLLTGDYPVRADTLAGVRAAHAARRSVPLDRLRVDLPEPLVSAISTALRHDPASRFSTASAFEAALRAPASPPRRSRVIGIGTALAIVVIAANVGLWNETRRSSGGPGAPPTSVLIVPFENRTGDGSLDGVVDALLERELMASATALVVDRSRIEDVLRMMRKPLSTRPDRGLAVEIAQRDGAIGAILRGLVERQDRGFVVTTELQWTAGRSEPAVERISTRGKSDLSASVRQLAGHVRARLGESRREIRQSAANLERVTTPSPEALRWYTDAYHLGTRQGAGRNWAASLDLSRQAVEQDPQFAAAHIWLAWSLYRTGHHAGDFLPVAQRAFELADTTTEWESHWIKGSYYTLSGAYDKAVPEYEALLILRPDHYWGNWNLTQALLALRRFDALLEPTLRQVELRPHDVATLTDAADALLRAADQRAPAFLERLNHELQSLPAERSTRFTRAWLRLRSAREAAARRDAAGARAALDAARSQVKDWAGDDGQEMARHLVLHYAGLGRIEDARDVAARLIEEAERHEHLAELAYATGDFAMTRQELRLTDPAALLPRQRVMAFFLATRTGSLENAEKIGRTLLTPGDPNATGLWVTGELALARDDAATALASFAQAWAPEGRPATYLLQLSHATALQRLNRLEEAARILEDALSARPREGIVWPTASICLPMQMHLAGLYQRLGKVDRARALLQDLALQLAVADAGFGSALSRAH